MGFLRLPEEILEPTLLTLCLRDIYTCQRVCTLLNEVISTNVNIQYKLELEIAGMKDEPQNSLSTSEKLGKLKELQKIWLVPRFSNEFIVSCGHNPFQRIGDTVFQLIYSEPAPGMTSCIQAPSRLKSIKRRDWTETHGTFPFPPLHVEVDHEQNLLVAVEGRKIEGFFSVSGSAFLASVDVDSFGLRLERIQSIPANSESSAENDSVSCILQFPPLADGWEQRQSTVYTSCANVRSSKMVSPVPFSLADDSKTVHIYLEVGELNPLLPPSYYNIVALASGLATCLQRAHAMGRNTLRWEDWGPSATRMLPAEYMSPGVGWRFLMLEDPSDDFPVHFSVLDFNPMLVRRELHKVIQGLKAGSPGTSYINTKPTDIAVPSFAIPIRTCLPYLVSGLRVPKPFGAVEQTREELLEDGVSVLDELQDGTWRFRFYTF
ncbi:predicted protein [Postia placenta Mad-698-R]|uniref:F-box domain-containing protein n=1 Tax=Postia placenta MAD-698-R-SB12 TaxID=670580 RepID=A0A1X6MLP8_9APHY|nr:hypothetical protein POSPLADRAFT_1157539 [Postia placenta MAD-698-R-SB12]EED81966.1 predicted protein [Postia placenta Mad-698-R]OSX57136.1 hypothetical protein POSPLADRAFT_1157539 [Postia placenta MAD-698-R-SB12]